MSKKALLITAGGKGIRMQSELPKQFMIINRKPILIHVITPFLQYAPDIEIVLVLPGNQIDLWKSLCKKHNFFHNHRLVSGGPTRFHSVKNGLKHISDNCIVAIHDGVRPLVSLNTIAKVFNYAEKFGNAVPVLDINESVRITEGAISKKQDRNKIKIVQTPQCFVSQKIKEAYNQNYRDDFTDDATVLESIGERIFLVEGNPENIKITQKQDMILAEALLKHQTD